MLYRKTLAARCPGVHFVDPAQHVIRAASVGLLAWQRFRRQDVDRIDRLVPDYIRPSDAQVHLSGSC